MKEKKKNDGRSVIYITPSKGILYMCTTILNAVTYRKDGSTVSDYRD